MSSEKIIPSSNEIPHLDLFYNEQNILSVNFKRDRVVPIPQGFPVESNSNVISSHGHF